jgi:hypothetical protein
MKITLNKFELPIVEDERSELIEERFGLIGFGIIVKLLARIYGTGGYFCTWNDKVIGILSKSLGVEARLISDVVAYAVGIGFFDGSALAERSVLTSADVQAQYFRSVSRRSGITYDPDIVIGDFYKDCRRALPFPESPIAVPKDTAPTSNTKKASVAEMAATVETAVTSDTDTNDDGIDPIIAMRCKHMFSRGKTVPIARLVEMTGASTLVPLDVLSAATEPNSDSAVVPATPKASAEDVPIAAFENAFEATAPTEDVSSGEEPTEKAAVIEEPSENEATAEPAEPTEPAATVEKAATAEPAEPAEPSVNAEADSKEKEPTDNKGDGRFIRDVKKPRRDKVYGQYFNVLLDDDEYADLAARVPNVGDYIQRLSARLYDKSFKCESAYDAIIDCYERAQRISSAA